MRTVSKSLYGGVLETRAFPVQEAGIQAMKIVLPVVVGWGTNVAAANCFVTLCPAFEEEGEESESEPAGGGGADAAV